LFGYKEFTCPKLALELELANVKKQISNNEVIINEANVKISNNKVKMKQIEADKEIKLKK
jgi:predicted  nucleic acid-binding Zn-ribbon protein